jgi:hypothetical protein
MWKPISSSTSWVMSTRQSHDLSERLIQFRRPGSKVQVRVLVPVLCSQFHVLGSVFAALSAPAIACGTQNPEP